MLGAISGGAEAGLRQAQLSTSAAESANNLRLAYARLGQQAAEDQANRAMQHELALAKMAEAQRSQDLLNQFRQASIAARERGLDISQEGLGFREETAEQKAAKAGQAKPLGEGKLTDLQKHDLDRASEDLSAAQKAHSAAVAKGDSDEAAAAKAAMDAAGENYRKERGQFDKPEPTKQGPGSVYMGPAVPEPKWKGPWKETEPGSQWLMPDMGGAGPRAAAKPQAAATETPKVTTQEQFDALPSGTVYIGQDGKRYRKP